MVSSVAGEVSTDGDCSGVGDGVGFGVGLGVAFGVGLGLGVGVGFGDGVGLIVAVGVGEGDGFGVGVGLGLGVGDGDGVGFGEGVGKGFGLDAGRGVNVGPGRGVEEAAGRDPLAVESGRTVGNVIGGLPETVGDADNTARGVGTGDAMIIGDGVGTGVGGTNDSVSPSVGRGDGVSNVSGAAVSSGFAVAFGDGFAVGVDLGFGLAVGVGLGFSSGAAGVLARNGVEAASCARTNAAVASNAMAKTNERMWLFLRKILEPTLARAHPLGQEDTLTARRLAFHVNRRAQSDRSSPTRSSKDETCR
ncbi:MAG: hypothetical protein ABR611_02315 [Chthoniobacterales bacterium]